MLHRHVGWMLFLVLWMTSGWGCGGGAQQGLVDEPMVVPEPVVEAMVEPERFVLVLPTTRLYREPDETAEFLQLRTVEQDAADREGYAKHVTARRERDVQADKAWNERESKRYTQARKKARGKKKRAAVQAASRERREAYRAKKIGREVGYARKDAQEFPFQAPGVQAIVLGWIAEHGDWIEVETTSAKDLESHCHGQGHAELGHFRMRFFVRRDELLQTMGDRTRIELQAGTSIELLPGTIVVPVSGKVPRNRVTVDGFEIVVPAAEQVLSDSYRPMKHFEMQTTDTIFSDEALVNKALRLDRKTHLPFNPYYRLFVLETSKARSTVYAMTQTPCARYVVKTRNKDLVAAPPNAMRFDLRTSQGPPARPYVLAGAQVFSVAGVPLGEAYVDAHLGVPIRDARIEDQSVSWADDSMCFRKPLGGRVDGENATGHSFLDLCVKVDDIVLHDLKVF